MDERGPGVSIAGSRMGRLEWEMQQQQQQQLQQEQQQQQQVTW
jgi:hypothetical protein